MKRSFLISCLLAGTIVSSCTTNHEDEILDREQPAQFNVSITSSDVKLKTRATDPTEEKLDHVAFYVFKKSGSLETSIAAPADQITSKKYTIDCTTGEKHVYAVTNDEALFNKIQKGTHYLDFEKMVTDIYATNPVSPFTMVGKYGETLTLKPSTDGTTVSAEIAIQVTRLVGKATVTLSTEAASKFVLNKFKIVNANPYSNYFLQSISYKPDNKVDPIPGNYESQSDFDKWTDGYYIDTYNYVSADQAAYALENWNSDPRRGNTTCLIIEGSYKGNTATYYRFNLGGKEAKWAFNRNTHYKVTINDVYENGYETDKDAEQPDPDGKPTDPLVQDVKLSATLSITPWVDVIQDDEIGKE